MSSHPGPQVQMMSNKWQWLSERLTGLLRLKLSALITIKNFAVSHRERLRLAG